PTRTSVGRLPPARPRPAPGLRAAGNVTVSQTHSQRRSVMWFTSWLRNGNCSGRGGRRLALETLESRDVPTTWTVTSYMDSGAGSLRAEIAAANPGDTIIFASSTAPQTITLNSSDLVINKSLTIQGPGAGQLTLSGAGSLYNSRLFEVDGALTNL